MTDHLAALRDRIARTEAKVQRYQKSLESADKELSDLRIALRVVEGIANEGDSNASGTSTTIQRQLDIVQLLRVGREKGLPPAEIYASYVVLGNEDITIDTFRTTIWRMKDRLFDIGTDTFLVQGDTGLYWKEKVIDLSKPATDWHADVVTRQEIEPHSASAGGSIADVWGEPTPHSSLSNPNPGWSS